MYLFIVSNFNLFYKQKAVFIVFKRLKLTLIGIVLNCMYQFD